MNTVNSFKEPKKHGSSEFAFEIYDISSKLARQFAINHWHEETEIIYRVKAKGNPHNIYSKSKCQTDVIKESDTIEELCDEFVLYYMDLNEQSDKDTFYPYAQYERCGNVWQKDKKNIIEKTIKGHHTLYGAIWTDKGLIYVAKMNDKGELENE